MRRGIERGIRAAQSMAGPKCVVRRPVSEMLGRPESGERKWVAPVSAYALSIALPCLASYVTNHLQWLIAVPFALELAGIATVAWFGRIGPSILSIILSVLLFNYYLDPPFGEWSLGAPDLARTATLFFVGTFIGMVTSRLRRTQRVLALQSEQHRTTLASIGDGVIATEPSGKIAFLNASAEQLTGWTSAEAQGKPIEEVFCLKDEKTGGPVESLVVRIQGEQRTMRFGKPILLVRKDGAKLNIDDSGAPIYSSRGALTGTVIVFRDVTGQRDVERALEERAAALAAAQAGSNSAAWALDLQTRVTRWFAGGREIFGRPFAEFADQPSPLHLVEPEDHAAIDAATLRSIERGEEFRVEFRVRWPNGDLHWLEARGKADSANPNIFYGVTADITERKQAEAALLRAEKLAAVGQVASTMAHEINNPLAGIVNLLYLALADETLLATTRGYLKAVDEEIARLAAITRLTLSFARESHGEQTANLAEVVDNVLSLVKRKIEAREIRIDRSVDPKAAVRIKPHELRQVLLNLTLNAIDASKGADDLIRVAVEPCGDRIAIRIEDNGCGIPEKLAERIFDPFFSTKPEIGTGIGLWVSKELVQRNGGSLTVASLNSGADARTRFEIRLPRA